jgi:hypothetical protein
MPDGKNGLSSLNGSFKEIYAEKIKGLIPYPHSRIRYEEKEYPNTSIFKKLHPNAIECDNKLRVVKVVEDDWLQPRSGSAAALSQSQLLAAGRRMGKTQFIGAPQIFMSPSQHKALMELVDETSEES